MLERTMVFLPETATVIRAEDLKLSGNDQKNAAPSKSLNLPQATSSFSQHEFPVSNDDRDNITLVDIFAEAKIRAKQVKYETLRDNIQRLKDANPGMTQKDICTLAGIKPTSFANIKSKAKKAAEKAVAKKD